MNKKLSIIVGLKDNKHCRKLEDSIRPIIESMLSEGYELENLEVTYNKSYFDDSVAAGFVNVGIMLEKFDNIAIGQGSIKVWNNLNPNMHLILVMDDMKKASAKAHGLYKREYYNGLFLSDFLGKEMIHVILHGRTKEEAYVYYGMDEYYKNRELEEKKQSLSNLEVTESVNTEKSNDLETGKAGDIVFNTSLNLETSKTVIETVSPGFGGLNIKPMKTDNVIITEEIPQQLETRDEELETVHSNEEGFIETNNTEDNAAEKKDEEIIDRVDIMSLQDEEVIPVTSSISVINDNDWTKYTAGVKKNSSTKDIVETKIEKGSSIKKVIELIGTLDAENEFFKKIIDEADLIIHDNEQIMPQKQSENKIVSDMYKDVVDYYSYKNEVELNTALSLIDNQNSMNSFLGTVQDYIDMINEQSYHVLEGDVLGEVFYLFLRFISEYDILTDFIDDEKVTSIHVVDWNKIRIKKGTKRYSVKNKFISESYYKRFVSNLKIRNAQNLISDHLSMYYTDRRVSEKFICNVSITNEYVSNTGRPEILIKKTRKERFTIKEIMGRKLTPAAAALLITAIKNGESILLVGPASCGATSLMNTMLEYIPREKSGVVLQHKDEIAEVGHPELIIQHPAIVRTKLEDVDNKEIDVVTSYSVLDIATSALKLDVDYYVMVDVVGAEAAPFYQAINDGFITWANVRANSVKSGLQRLADTIIASKPDLSRDAVCSMIANKFSIVVYMEKLRVVNISMVPSDGYDSINHTFNVKEVITSKRK